MLVAEPQRAIQTAAQLLSSLSSFAGGRAVSAPCLDLPPRRILRLSDRRTLMIVVSPEGDVHNRILITERPYRRPSCRGGQRAESAVAGLSFEQARASLRGELSALRQEMADLMEAAVQAGAEEVERSDPVVISGERNLLGVNDLAADMDKLRALFDLFDHKARLLQCWTSRAARRACRSTSAVNRSWCRWRS